MVSDSELIERLREFLSSSDLDTTTTAIVRRQLEDDFGIDLSDRKTFIREQVDIYMQSQLENVDDNEDEAEEVVKEDENEDEETEDEGEDESTASTDGNSSSKKRKKEEVKKKGGGFTKLCTLSPQLQSFTGVPELARTEVVKQLWKYIKENNLQDPSNKRDIICDEALRNLFGMDTINMFQMNKVLTQHIWPLGSDCAVIKSPKEKPEKRDSDEDEDEPKRKQKKQKGVKQGGNSNLQIPVKLSDALVKFLGIEENALPRSDVVKRIWDYIKLNNLQDPSDKRQILCDEKLKELFNVDTFHGFSVAKHLTAHLTKMEL